MFEICQIRHMSNQVSEHTSRASLTEGRLEESDALALALLFKALGDPTRLRLLGLVAAHEGGAVCVCDLTEGFDLTAPTISYHLKVLRDAGLVLAERRGTWIYYSVDRAVLTRLSDVLGAQVRSSA